MLPELFQDPADCIDMRLARILGVNKNVVQVHITIMSDFLARILLMYP